MAQIILNFFETSFRFSRRRCWTRDLDLAWTLFLGASSPSFRSPVAGKSQGQETSRCLIRIQPSTQLYSAELRLAGKPGHGAAFLRSLAAAQTLLVLPLVARPWRLSAVRRGISTVVMETKRLSRLFHRTKFPQLNRSGSGVKVTINSGAQNSCQDSQATTLPFSVIRE